MAWWELQITARSAAVDALSDALFAHGAAGLHEDYLPGQAPPPRQPWDTGPPPPEPPLRLIRATFDGPDRDAVDAAVRSVVGEQAATAWSPLEEVDWEARFRASFPPLVISPRLTVAAPWDAPPGALIIEPGQGFGTGDHPTTRQALAALDRLADHARTVLDVGCGSGILALAAAKLGLEATGVDIDPVAVREAYENAERNDLQAHFSTTPVDALHEPADLVLANLYAEVIVALAPSLIRLTRGWLVLAGVLADREDTVRRALDALVLDARTQDGEWVSLVYRSPA